MTKPKSLAELKRELLEAELAEAAAWKPWSHNDKDLTTWEHAEDRLIAAQIALSERAARQKGKK